MLCVPTGGGKSLITSSLINLLAAQRGRTIVYNSRRLLTQQAYNNITDDGIDAGTRAAALKDFYDPNAPVQVAQLQTDIARILKQQRWSLHQANLVIIDEAHMNMAPRPIELMQKYLAQGSFVLGLTGTPVGMSGAYRDIVVAATNSELRQCGAHVPARCFSVHEMDVDKIKKEKNGEYSEGAIKKELWNQAIVGHIYEDWRRLNPDCGLTLCAAPGIGESIWVAEKFRAKGLRVAHIDCNKVIVNGEVYQNDTKGTVRNQVIKDVKSGMYDILCHCSVIQEGVDIVELRHLILARPYGSLANYIQSVGRVIRSAPGKSIAIVQDHGGNFVRHGSPNANRDWEKLFSMSEKEIASERKKDIQEGKEKAPIVCVKCGTVRLEGAKCPSCGHQADPRLRCIVEKDGKLVERIVDEFAKPPEPPPIELKRLKEIFFAMRRHTGKSPSESQVLAIYANKHGDYPPTKYVDQWRNERELAIRKKRGEA